MTESYQVKLDGFEGPLDLLLHLINRYEIDIYDIPVSKITEQYMNYVHAMQELELNMASEYLVMAASLLAIKSQMLLPTISSDEELTVEEEEDPRDELMNRLIEYKRYKEAAEELKQKELDANRIYTRPEMDLADYAEEQGVTEGEASVYDMIAAMGNILKRKKTEQPKDATIKRDEVSIRVKMDDILKQVDDIKEGLRFSELFAEHSKPQMVVTFIAILELMKSKEVTCIQESHLEDLIVFKMEETP
ncbi:segregation/condensation protein A [Halobacillus shinanisalinarum]|uniref:Segregation and condensation protein A n=1 Tax=Halobacillus shinanisalinarum TaxID=2932258 RepID=A0ABY4H016_9BACI|nr:segregation/condensation protein A [Halobacillus shinanisalinarum]UOQ93631.1 segregation/condensation protein A [Halobacillus shinanisalinarum]